MGLSGIAIEPKWLKVSRFKLVADRINRMDRMTLFGFVSKLEKMENP